MSISSVHGSSKAVTAALEAVDLARQRQMTHGEEHALALAASLDHLSAVLHSEGWLDDALTVAEEGVAFCRGLDANRGSSSGCLARSLNTLAVVLGSMGHLRDSVAAAREAVSVRDRVEAHVLCVRPLESQVFRNNLAVALNRVGQYEEALAISAECVSRARVLSTKEAFARFLLAEALDTLAHSQSGLGHRADAISAGEESVNLHRRLVDTVGDAVRPHLASALNNLANFLSDARRFSDAIEVAEESVGVRRSLAAAERERHLAGLAGALVTLGAVLSNAGRTATAIKTDFEAATLCRELVVMDRRVGLPDLAGSLTNLSASLQREGRAQEAAECGIEARAYWRELLEINREIHLPSLENCLLNLASALGSTARHDDAVLIAREAVQLARELAVAHELATLPKLAKSLTGLGVCLGHVGARAEAVAAATEAVDLYRRLLAGDRPSFMFDLAAALLNQSVALKTVGRQFEADRSWRECAMLVLQIAPVPAQDWVQLARGITGALVNWSDLRDWHLPLIRLLVEHRELAHDTEQATLYFELQRKVASRAWDLLRTLPSRYSELLDELVVALVAALHSPDLASWMQARGDFGEPGSGFGAELARIKREVIEAEQLLAALRNGQPGGHGAGSRIATAFQATGAPRDASTNDMDHQFARAEALRQAFRVERARVMAVDPRFSAAFEPLGPQALRSLARHGDGGAVLCVLQLPASRSNGQAEPSSPAQHRSVAALLYADGRRTQLLELSGLSELAWHAQCYAPEHIDRGRGPLRGAPAGVPGSAPTDAVPPAMADLLASRISGTFWAPLQQALQESVAVDRLHVCLHGTTQQLPLALRQDSDCPGLQVVPWPGLPYLRLAASTAAAATSPSTPPAVPWLVGHDCAWASEQPLPMVAVEAALLRHLLQQHGQPVQAIAQAAQLSGDAAALVACCHGGAEQAQFDHALHLGGQPLTVRQILNDHLGPHLALLPACYAGRTDEDAAGNALGVAAAFMLSGTKVVVASSKAVPDVLQPWLSTLMVWHAMQGRPHHEAATLARAQFASLQFPDGYRSWVQQALRQALATIQLGGEEDEHIRGVHAQTALEQVEERWPWEGETRDLFSADPAKREEATRLVVQGILVPRGGEAGARALAAEAREMAAFVFVYGLDSTPGCVRHEPDQDTGRPRWRE